MLQEISVGGIIISTDSTSEDTFFTLSNPETGETESVRNIPKEHHFLVLTVIKLLVLELQDEEKVDVATIKNRISGAEEMLINVLEVLFGDGNMVSNQINQFLKQLEREYKQVGTAVYGKERVRQYLRNTPTPSTDTSHL